MTREGIGISIGGTAVVVCVHNRVKREVKTEGDIAALGLTVGQVYDPKQHKIHKCACCENLFVNATDVPRYCSVCSKPPVYAVAGLMAEPKGVVNE